MMGKPSGMGEVLKNSGRRPIVRDEMERKEGYKEEESHTRVSSYTLLPRQAPAVREWGWRCIIG